MRVPALFALVAVVVSVACTSQKGTTDNPAVTFNPKCGMPGDHINVHVRASAFTCNVASLTEMGYPTMWIGNQPATIKGAIPNADGSCSIDVIVQPGSMTGRVSAADHPAMIGSTHVDSLDDYVIPCPTDGGMESGTVTAKGTAGSIDCATNAGDNKVNCSATFSSEQTVAADKPFYDSLREPHAVSNVAVNQCGPIGGGTTPADAVATSVGDVSVLDPTNVLFTMKPGPGPYFPYYGQSTTPGFGKTLAFQFAGAPGGVDPHTATGPALPTSIAAAITTPLKPLFISKTGDTMLAWTPFKSDSFTMQFDSIKQACKFDSMAGQGAIPLAIAQTLAMYGNFRFDATNFGTAAVYASGVGAQITAFVNEGYAYQLK